MAGFDLADVLGATVHEFAAMITLPFLDGVGKIHAYKNGKYEDVSCFTMVDDNSIGADMCMDPQEGTPRVVKAEDARGLGCENRRGEEVIEVCINVHPTHGTDRRLHVEPEPRSSFDAILRARGREVCRDELVSNKFHVCVGQKIGVPPKLRDVPSEEIGRASPLRLHAQRKLFSITKGNFFLYVICREPRHAVRHLGNHISYGHVPVLGRHRLISAPAGTERDPNRRDVCLLFGNISRAMPCATIKRWSVQQHIRICSAREPKTI